MWHYIQICYLLKEAFKTLQHTAKYIIIKKHPYENGCFISSILV